MTARRSYSRDLRALALRMSLAFRNMAGKRAGAIRAATRLARSKRMVFCITSGRSGSAVLAEHFACLEGVDAEHEAVPKFTWLLREVQRNPGLAADFLLYEKLPQIAGGRKPVYVETSHLFGKGFLEPLLSLGIVPDLVLLRREARDVARSLYRLDWIPGRSKYGLLFFLQPDDPVLRRLRGWRELTDYQLCYWHALETEARQAAYGAAIRGWGGRAVDAETRRLAEPGYFETVGEALGIPLTIGDRERLAAIRGRRFNTKAEDTLRSLNGIDLDAEEAVVRERLASRSAEPRSPVN